MKSSPPSRGHGGPRAGAGRLPGIKEVKPRATVKAEDALKVLTTDEEKKHWRQLVEAAEANPKLKLEVLSKISELRRGKPFTAENPRARKQPPADNRILVAVQALIGGTPAAKPAKTKTKRKLK